MLSCDACALVGSAMDPARDLGGAGGRCGGTPALWLGRAEDAMCVALSSWLRTEVLDRILRRVFFTAAFVRALMSAFTNALESGVLMLSTGLHHHDYPLMWTP